MKILQSRHRPNAVDESALVRVAGCPISSNNTASDISKFQRLGYEAPKQLVSMQSTALRGCYDMITSQSTSSRPGAPIV